MEKTCAVTGHRPTRFVFRYNESHPLCEEIKNAMAQQFRQLYDEDGVRRVIVGGAQGVDMWAGEIVLRLKALPAYSALQLHVALPFAGHDARWDARSRARLAALVRQSDTCVTVCETPDRESYLARNRYMVDRADVLLAVYDNEKSLRSGTMATVRYAQKKNLPIVLIHPDTAAIGRMV